MIKMISYRPADVPGSQDSIQNCWIEKLYMKTVDLQTGATENMLVLNPGSVYFVSR